MAAVAVFTMGSCKNNNEAEGNVAAEPSQVDNYPENVSDETQRAADTTSKAEEDSIMEQPTP